MSLRKHQRSIGRLGGFSALIAVIVWLATFGSVAPASADTSAAEGDASITYDATAGTWTLTTTGISKTLRYDGSTFLMTSLTNRHTGRAMLQGGRTGVEFQVGMNGTYYTGSKPGWALESHSVTTPGDNTVRLTVALRQGPAKVVMNYVVMPNSSAIEQYPWYYNVSAAAVTISDPEIIDTNFLSADMSAGNVKFYHFNGAENAATNSWGLNTVTPTSSWVAHPRSTGMAAKNSIPEMIWSVPKYNDGLILGWSYTGTWYTAFSGNGRAQVDANGMNGRSLPPGASIGMPLSHLIAFKGPARADEGDLEAAGRELKNFQYTHKWDSTIDDNVAAIKPYLYVGTANPLTQAQLFTASQHFAHVGATVFHLDDGWQTADTWNPRVGINMAQLNALNEDNGMETMVWYPVWDQPANSSLSAQHPEWFNPTTSSSWCSFQAGTADMGIGSATNALVADLGAKVSDWGGSIIWRQDGAGSGFAGNGINEARASLNYFKMMADFRAQNPGSGVNVNHCGGNQISVESVRHSDLVQTTDGGAGRFSVYSPTYLFPADKLWGTTPGNGNIRWSATRAELRAQLATSWQWNGIGTPTYAELEAFRVNADLYRFMKSRGLAGRWSQTYHPRVAGDSESYYLQRSNADGTKAVIIPMHAHDLGAGYNMVYPEGLIPTRQYTVTFQMPNGNFTYTNTGQHWMDNGIGAHDFGGALVWIGVTDFPGSGNDATAPGAPATVTKSSSSYMGFAGVKIAWEQAIDDTWISYYEVFRNGTSIGKRPAAQMFFDKGGALGDVYTVRAVDGDGNASAPVTAQ